MADTALVCSSTSCSDSTLMRTSMVRSRPLVGSTGRGLGLAHRQGKS